MLKIIHFSSISQVVVRFISLKNFKKRISTASQDITDALLKLMKKQNFNEITVVDIVLRLKLVEFLFIEILVQKKML